MALGHHKDDIIETTLLNLFFQGEFSTMNPRQEMFKGKIVIIRPLCYVEEKMTKRFAAENNFPEQLCRCPYAPPTSGPTSEVVSGPTSEVVSGPASEVVSGPTSEVVYIT